MITVRRFRVAAGAVAAALILVTPVRAGAPGEPAAMFSTKCSSCHTYGQGDRVGPDLKGATARHPRGWLVSWIRSSERMIREGDVAAVSLFRRYRQQRMPDHQLSDGRSRHSSTTSRPAVRRRIPAGRFAQPPWRARMTSRWDATSSSAAGA
jgi:mono/diheme cytochrome c family protein